MECAEAAQPHTWFCQSCRGESATKRRHGAAATDRPPGHAAPALSHEGADRERIAQLWWRYNDHARDNRAHGARLGPAAHLARNEPAQVTRSKRELDARVHRRTETQELGDSARRRRDGDDDPAVGAQEARLDPPQDGFGRGSRLIHKSGCRAGNSTSKRACVIAHVYVPAPRRRVDLRDERSVESVDHDGSVGRHLVPRHTLAGQLCAPSSSAGRSCLSITGSRRDSLATVGPALHLAP